MGWWSITWTQTHGGAEAERVSDVEAWGTLPLDARHPLAILINFPRIDPPDKENPGNEHQGTNQRPTAEERKGKAHRGPRRPRNLNSSDDRIVSDGRVPVKDQESRPTDAQPAD